LATLDAPLSYATYARDQQEYLQSKSQSETESYWINQYTGDIPVVEFPNDHVRPALRSFHAKRIDVPVPPEIVSRLRALGRKTNTSFVTLMLASFETFVYRVTGQEELVIGLPAAGQNVEGLYNLVGHCVNLLPLRSTVNPKKSFSEFLKERRTYMFDAFDHQQFTFGSLIQKLNIHRDPSRIPLVPVVMNVDIGFTEGFQFEGCKFNVSTNPRFFENFEMLSPLPPNFVADSPASRWDVVKRRLPFLFDPVARTMTLVAAGADSDARTCEIGTQTEETTVLTLQDLRSELQCLLPYFL
jgi:hypothetical protein